MLSSVKGFHDILPQEAALWEYIEKTARDVFRTYNFSEIRLPILEKTELFARGIGSTTDIVEKEMYTFPDKNGESLTLRPEGTASVVRACIEHKLCNMPVTKLYYFGPMFRHERPQKGRYRQFYQIGAEVLGADEPMVDTEVIDMLLTLFERIKLNGINLEINSIGCKGCRQIYRERLIDFLSDKSQYLCENCQRRVTLNPLRVIDCKSHKCIEITSSSPSILDSICLECKNHFEEVKRHLTILGRTFSVNPRMVRGLDYYTKTTFEVTSTKLGSQNAVAAGGRYDGLVKELGGPDVSGFGFAVGVERLALILQESSFLQEDAPLFIISMGEEAEREAIKILKKMRASHFRIEMGCKNKGIKQQMKIADRIGARFTLILGEDELIKREITIKDMKTGGQERADIDKIVDKIRDKTSQI